MSYKFYHNLRENSLQFSRTFIAFLLITFLLLTQVNASSRKVALVIGNNNYVHAPSLRNAANDARAIAKALKKIDFDVILAENLNLPGFADVLKDFSRRTKDADISVVYYAGHGIQVDGATYIVPTDAELKEKEDLVKLIPAERVLNFSAKARKVSVVILDACRDNPLTRSLSEAVGTTRSTLVGRGLSKINNVPRNTLIAYATQAGNVALDGTGANSPYASALVKHITHADRDIRMVFGSVRDHVLNATDLRQEPFIYGSLGGDPIYLHKKNSGATNENYAHAFNPKVVTHTGSLRTRANEIVPITSDFAAWQRAKQSNDWALVEQIRIEHPQSIYGTIADILLHLNEQNSQISVQTAVQHLKSRRVNIGKLSDRTIRTLQRKLAAANYYSGPINGRSSRVMKNSLYAFIRDTYRGGFVSYHALLALGEIADLGNSSEKLSGTWRGKYFYPKPNKGVTSVDFDMSLVLSQAKVYGSVIEPNTFGNKTSKNLYANFNGTISGNTISWTKTYDGTAGVKHSVQYSGTIDRVKRRIEGKWRIGNFSGKFYIELQKRG